MLHRDLKPKNLLANADCGLKLCDFGLARPAFDGLPQPAVWTVRARRWRRHARRSRRTHHACCGRHLFPPLLPVVPAAALLSLTAVAAAARFPRGVHTPPLTPRQDYVATRWYRAPELCGSFFASYSPAIDIWGAGCIFGELLSGRPLFPGRNVAHQLELITGLLGTPAPEALAKARRPPAASSFLQPPARPLTLSSFWNLPQTPIAHAGAQRQGAPLPGGAAAAAARVP